MNSHSLDMNTTRGGFQMPPIVIRVAMHNYVENLNGILHLCASQVVDTSILINYDILRQISWLMIIFGRGHHNKRWQ